MAKTKIFLVHGHDHLAVLQLKDFLNDLGVEAVLLLKQDCQSKTLIECFEHFAKQCKAAFILLTPDDEQMPKTGSKEAMWRARQNVILEMGWFMAALGRSRVMLLHKGDVELPSDVTGVVYERFETDVLEKSEKIRARLRNLGIIS